jgi:hypothetical protein
MEVRWPTLRGRAAGGPLAWRNGLLVASAGATQRAILLADGDLAWASSSESSERTNELVCRIDLADHTARVAPDRLQGALRRQIGVVLSGFLEMSEGVFSMRGFEPSAALKACAFNSEEMLLRAMQFFDERDNAEPETTNCAADGAAAFGGRG